MKANASPDQQGTRAMSKSKSLSRRGIGLAFVFALSSFISHPSSFRVSQAAEIQLKSECNASGLVRLGDVAEIHSHDPAEVRELKDIELFPAPPPGGKSLVRAREVQDLLALRGMNLSQHRLTGASQDDAWKIETALDEEQARIIDACKESIQAGGG